MRVLHVVESLDRGGLERVVVDLASAQQAAGHEVSVCCVFRTGALAAELVARGIRVDCAEKRRGIDLRAIFRINQEICRLGAQVVHTHNAVANYYGAIAALPHPRLRVINTRHGMGAARAGVTERLYKASLCRTAAVAAVCERARSHFVSQGLVSPGRACVVRNGIRMDAFHPRTPASRAEVRAALKIGGNAFVVGSVGRLNWAKDHALLIDSFLRLHAHRSDAVLVLVGEGELRGQLEERIAASRAGDAILLLGDRGDVPRLLCAFDVFAMTSATEGYSIALLEAAAVGLPVIASDVGGNGEIVRDGTTGLIVGERTAERFARALESLAANPALCDAMGREARAWAERHATLPGMVAAYRALYERPASSACGVRDEVI